MENAMMYGVESKLRLPSCFVEVTDNEVEYLNGGSVVAIAGLIIAAATAGYGGAYAVGIYVKQELGVKSLNIWQKLGIQAGLNVPLGPILGNIMYVGFINGFNSVN